MLEVTVLDLPNNLALIKVDGSKPGYGQGELVHGDLINLEPRAGATAREMEEHSLRQLALARQAVLLNQLGISQECIKEYSPEQLIRILQEFIKVLHGVIEASHAEASINLEHHKRIRPQADRRVSGGSAVPKKLIEDSIEGPKNTPVQSPPRTPKNGDPSARVKKMRRGEIREQQSLRNAVEEELEAQKEFAAESAGRRRKASPTNSFITALGKVYSGSHALGAAVGREIKSIMKSLGTRQECDDISLSDTSLKSKKLYELAEAFLAFAPIPFIRNLLTAAGINIDYSHQIETEQNKLREEKFRVLKEISTNPEYKQTDLHKSISQAFDRETRKKESDPVDSESEQVLPGLTKSYVQHARANLINSNPNLYKDWLKQTAA